MSLNNGNVATPISDHNYLSTTLPIAIYRDTINLYHRRYYIIKANY